MRKNSLSIILLLLLSLGLASGVSARVEGVAGYDPRSGAAVAPFDQHLLFALWEEAPWHEASLHNEAFEIRSDGTVSVAGLEFATLSDYVRSSYFQETGKRCGTTVQKAGSKPLADPGDCTLTRTVIQSEYWSNQVYTIPIVFHVIHKMDGTGNIGDQRIANQVQVLNEDFRALLGSMGAPGFDTKIQFELAGITRTANDVWFQDQNEREYKTQLGWDQDRYLNVYVNSSGGFLGYSYLPQDNVDKVLDGVVILFRAVGGRNTGFDPYNQGRTLVHEIGHYLGLLHPFEGYACLDSYDAGDLIADTNSENDEHYACTQTFSCGTPDNIHNYMSYTDDACMNEFTSEQANRAACSLLNYRPFLYQVSFEFSYLPLVLNRAGTR